MLATNQQLLERGGCPVCFATLRGRDTDEYNPESVGAHCDFCGIHAKSQYESAGVVLLLWEHNQYKLCCRQCDERIFHSGTTRFEQAVTCARRHVVGCFLCERLVPPTQQILVVTDSIIFGMFFACSGEHYQTLLNKLCKNRDKANGWCRRCNIVWNHSTTPTANVDQKWHTNTATLVTRCIEERPFSWYRWRSWATWYYDDGIELGFVEKMY